MPGGTLAQRVISQVHPNGSPGGKVRLCLGHPRAHLRTIKGWWGAEREREEGEGCVLAAHYDHKVVQFECLFNGSIFMV